MPSGFLGGLPTESFAWQDSLGTVSAKDKSALPDKVSRVPYLFMTHFKRETRDSPITLGNRIWEHACVLKKRRADLFGQSKLLHHTDNIVEQSFFGDFVVFLGGNCAEFKFRRLSRRLCCLSVWAFHGSFHGHRPIGDGTHVVSLTRATNAFIFSWLFQRNGDYNICFCYLTS
jgi:hypothetical protein